MQNRLAWSCEVSKRTVRDDGMDPVAGERSSPASPVRQLRNIHTFIMDEVFTRMRKDNCSMGTSAKVVFLEHLNPVCSAALRGPCKSMRDYGKAVFLVVVALLTSLSLQAQWKTRWEYEGAKGPDHWSELDPAYASCNAGMAQSPIDIEASEKAALPALRFESRSGPLKYIVNNGYTIRVNYHDAAGTGNLLIVGDRTYQLTQFHFHRPSEEYIHGKAYDMAAHLMYQSSDGNAVGVAVLLQAGKSNETIQRIWEHMPIIRQALST